MGVRFKRLLAGVIDFYVICFLSSSLVYIITLGSMEVTPITIGLYLAAVFVFAAIKDTNRRDASLGKRILKIKVRNVTEDGCNITFLIGIKRTLPMLLIPLEIWFMISRGRRLGDLWAGTEVVDG